MWRAKSQNGSMMNDISLEISDSAVPTNHMRENSGTGDQMLELWETSENDSLDGSMVSETMKKSYVLTQVKY